MSNNPKSLKQSRPQSAADAELGRKWAAVVSKHKRTQQAQINILPARPKVKLSPEDKARLNDMSHAFYVGDAPTEDTKHTPEIPRMKHIEGYPAASAPLPEGIDSVEVIERYPNHLYGQLLLQIARTWTPKEIEEACPAKEINRSMISGRLKYAKKKFLPDYKPRTYSRVGRPQAEAKEGAKAKEKRKGRDEALAAALVEI